MKLYRVSYNGQSAVDDQTEATAHEGYTWHSSKAGANKAIVRYMKENKDTRPARPEPEEFVFDSSKVGFITLLNHVATHPDNG